MRKVYLDNASTTSLLPEVRDAMLPYLGELYGNPSCMHEWGDAARDGIESSRQKVAELIDADSEDVIFTASGTESNNFAIKGLAMAQQSKGKHVIVSAVEHFSVLNSAKTLEKWGFEVTVIPVDKNATIDPENVRKAIRKDTILVSIIHASSEVGTIQPIKEIAKITKESNVVFHTDAVATVGTVPVSVKDLGVDALSMAGNQFYGPKGSGALWVRKGVRIIPFLDGGVQEGGRRAGTENVPAIVGMGIAAEVARAKMQGRSAKLTILRDRLLKEIPTKIERVIVTGHPRNRLPGHASFCVEFIEGEAMLLLLSAKGIYSASGSACSSKALKASPVLLSMGIPSGLAQGSIVFTLGMDNMPEHIEYLLSEFPAVIKRLREISPYAQGWGDREKGGGECTAKG